MSLANGVASSLENAKSSDVSISSNKRKREEPTDTTMNGASTHPALLAPKQIIVDVFEMLTSHEAAPVILNQSLPSPPQGSASHPLKRMRLDESSTSSTITTKVKEEAYASLSELEADITQICHVTIAALKENEDSQAKTRKRLDMDDVVQIQEIMAFEVFTKETVARENARIDSGRALEQKSNGIKEEGTSRLGQIPPAGRTVLSLFGNAPTPRQLFSSLQQEEASLDMGLEELGLPTMLTASKVFPLPRKTAPSYLGRTFQDVFGTPPAVQPMVPPRQGKSNAARGSTISFTTDERPNTKSSRRGPYTLQSLGFGKYLAYGTARAERRIREGEVDESALFASACSSFAPAYDSTKAVVSRSDLDLLYWQKYGRRHLDRLLRTSSKQTGAGTGVENGQQAGAAADEADEALGRLIEGYDGEELTTDMDGLADSLPADMATTELLDEINDLIRALASFQRIRSAVPHRTDRRSSISSPVPTQSNTTGTPFEPSQDEIDTYRDLTERLATLVERIPPYIVAKLSGEQVEDLMVTQTIAMEGRNGRGVMEEDQLTRMARSAAAAAAATAASSTSANVRTNSTSAYSRYGSSTKSSGLLPASFQTSDRSSGSYSRSNSGLIGTPKTSANRSQYAQPAHGRPSLSTASGQPNSQQYYNRSSYGPTSTTAIATPSSNSGVRSNSLSGQQYPVGKYPPTGNTYRYNDYAQYGSATIPAMSNAGRTTPGAAQVYAAQSPIKPGTPSYAGRQGSGTPQPIAQQAYVAAPKMNGNM